MPMNCLSAAVGVSVQDRFHAEHARSRTLAKLRTTETNRAPWRTAPFSRLVGPPPNVGCLRCFAINTFLNLADASSKGGSWVGWGNDSNGGERGIRTLDGSTESATCRFVITQRTRDAIVAGAPLPILSYAKLRKRVSRLPQLFLPSPGQREAIAFSRRRTVPILA
jgi:hypothetical protein